MGKCLVTKLNGSSNNSNLLRIGEMRMKIAKVEKPTDATQGFGITLSKPVTLTIVSDGYFTNKNLTENKGKTLVLNTGNNAVFVSNNDVEISIADKYSITAITASYPDQSPSSTFSQNIALNISDLKYSAGLTILSLSGASAVTGDIGDLKNLTALTNISLVDTQITGDIGDLKNLTALTTLNLTDTLVYGDISGLKSLTALVTLSLFNTQIIGNIGDLKNLTEITNLNLCNKQIPLTGNIGALSTLTNCKSMLIQYSKLTGDLATLPSSCRLISLRNDAGSSFTWSTRSSSAKIIAIEGNASIDNIDKMLQGQAQCQVGFTSNENTMYKTISCSGTRTSASDAAVEILQQKGYTISIAKA